MIYGDHLPIWEPRILVIMVGRLRDQSPIKPWLWSLSCASLGRKTAGGKVCFVQPLPASPRGRTLDTCTWIPPDSSWYVFLPWGSSCMSFFCNKPQPWIQPSWVLGIFPESHRMGGWLWTPETQPLTSRNLFYKNNQAGGQGMCTWMWLQQFL